MAVLFSVPDENGSPGLQGRPVCPPAFLQFAFIRAVFPIHRIRSVIHISAQLLECPAKQAGTVGDHVPDPFASVLPAERPVCIRGLFDGLLLRCRPFFPVSAPDITPLVSKRLLELLDKRLGRYHLIVCHVYPSFCSMAACPV